MHAFSDSTSSSGSTCTNDFLSACSEATWETQKTGSMSDVDLQSMLSWDGVSETSTDINDVDWDDLVQCFNVEVDTEVCNVCNQEFLAQPG